RRHPTGIIMPPSLIPEHWVCNWYLRVEVPPPLTETTAACATARRADDPSDHRRGTRLSVQPEAARRAALPAYSPCVGAPGLSREPRASGAARRPPPASHPARRRRRARGARRLDAADPRPRELAPRPFRRSPRSGDGVPGRPPRGLRRRVADEADVPLSLGVRPGRGARRGDPPPLVPHQHARRPRGLARQGLLGATDRSARGGGLERDDRPGHRGELPA